MSGGEVDVLQKIASNQSVNLDGDVVRKLVHLGLLSEDYDLTESGRAFLQAHARRSRSGWTMH